MRYSPFAWYPPFPAMFIGFQKVTEGRVTEHPHFRRTA